MTVSTANPSLSVSYSPYDYAIHENPYPTYTILRDQVPLYHNEELDFWALSRHADVAMAFRDHDRFSSVNGVSIDPTAWGPHADQAASFLAMDPPRHTRMRSLISKGFTPRRVGDLQPRIVDLTRRYLKPALDGGEYDFVAEFAGKLPMDIISEMLGVPETDRDEVRRLAGLVVHREEGLDDLPPAAIDAAFALFDYYAGMIAERRRRRTDDLTSALLDAEIDGDRLDDPEIVAFLFLMVVAGNETTTKLLANALYWGWRNPDEGAKPFADPARVADWVEETLRYDTSSQQMARTVAADVEIHGRVMPRGARLLLLIGSANRDPRVFPEAERYDLDRDTSQAISFGAGRHHCLGVNLARLEARTALTEFVRRVESYEIDEAGAVRVHSSNVRGFAALPVRVKAR
jgi:cytochrome P450